MRYKANSLLLAKSNIAENIDMNPQLIYYTRPRPQMADFDFLKSESEVSQHYCTVYSRGALQYFILSQPL